MNADVDAIVAGLGDWRGDMLARLRAIVLGADSGIVEEVKWRKPSNPLGVPVWSKGGMICTGESYRDKVKLTFMHGGVLDDPHGLFRDEPGRTRRAIDFREGDLVDADALAALVAAAIRFNLAKRG